jgi:glycine/D-amino acid oxidase-like deaminating enzyme
VPLPYPVLGAVRFSDQAQLHATNYLGGLARSVAREDSHVFEQTRAAKVEDGSPCRIDTEDGSVIADAVLIATNFPMLDRGLFFARCHPHRSYLVALRLDGELPEGTFISADEPLRSVLPYRHGDESFLLVGGEGHRASDSVDAGERYLKLENWARERFPVSHLEYRWSTQDAVPVDGVPYVGKMSPFSKNLYVATGFRKWGLTNGTVAAMILCDQILDRPNPWARTFSSNRFRPIAAAPRFVSENLRVGARLMGDWVKSRPRSWI